MRTITAQNVNDAFAHGMTLLASEGTRAESRNGPVYVCAEPVTTHYRYPMQRVLFLKERDANPFFHLLEALWMLGGQRDVARMKWLVPRMAQYSDDGVTFHAAYGYRWRHWQLDTREPDEGMDQLPALIELLTKSPTTRRAVLQMWNPFQDLLMPPSSSKDLPCNVAIKFSIANERLNMAVFNRSNDIIMGCYGANAVHLSILQEYVARMVGVPMGWYEQISCDFHAYVEEFDRYWARMDRERPPDPYQGALIFPLIDNPATFDVELERFLAGWRTSLEDASDPRLEMFENAFLTYIATPMLQAYWIYRHGDPQGAYRFLHHLTAGTPADWLLAGEAWMYRRWRNKHDAEEQFEERLTPIAPFTTTEHTP